LVVVVLDKRHFTSLGAAFSSNINGFLEVTAGEIFGYGFNLARSASGSRFPPLAGVV
jgi:hypothetical protein